MKNLYILSATLIDGLGVNISGQGDKNANDLLKLFANFTEDSRLTLSTNQEKAICLERKEGKLFIVLVF